MLYFAGFKDHYSLFAASGTFFAVLEDELTGYELRKGTVHFPLSKPVPVKLISRIANLRAAGISVSRKTVSGGVVHEVPADLKKALTSRPTSVNSTGRILPSARAATSGYVGLSQLRKQKLRSRRIRVGLFKP